MARSIRESKPQLQTIFLRTYRSRRQDSGSRRQYGSQLAELGPGLLVLIVMTFFPFMLIVSLGVTYGSGWTLNDLQLREAAVVPKYEAIAANGNVKKNIPETWRTMGLGKYTGLVSFPETTVTYKKGMTDGANRQDWKVIVTTKIVAKPFVSMSVPFLSGVPGLSAPMTFQFSGERMVESQEDAEKEAP